ncbi:MAG TPA: hypothetical protein VF595_15220 [Tepidisphaeraceae bacterium]|jgi:hypothetical protein
MEGNIVKAAWILGGSILGSVVLAGIGLFIGMIYLSNGFYEQLDMVTKRSAEAIMKAPENTRVAVRSDENDSIKLGFDRKLPISMHIENSMDENRQKRAVFEVEVKPTLSK